MTYESQVVDVAIADRARQERDEVGRELARTLTLMRRAVDAVQRILVQLNADLGEAGGRPRVAPPRLGTCGIEPTQPHEFDRDACTGWAPLDPSPSESKLDLHDSTRR